MPREATERPLDQARRVLAEEGILHRSGGVLMSAEATLRKGVTYFVGLNPGGEDDAPHSLDDRVSDYPTIAESLEASRMGCNAFDQDWSTATRSYAPGQSPMQSRFKFVCRTLRLCYAEVCATNFVFTRSTKVADHTSWERDLRASAKVHSIFLEAVQPDFLWVQGNPETVDLQVDMEWQPSGYSNWSIGRGTATLGGKEYPACHTPHLSFWNPEANVEELLWAFQRTGRMGQP
jgi:hypothetical protein